MNTKELKTMLEVAATLGYEDIPMYFDDSRDGEDILVPARARLRKTSSQTDGEEVVLVIGYG